MGESLSPVEVAHEAHRHREHANHDSSGTVHRHQRVLQIVEAALLAGVTVLAAWSGFAAASYETDSRIAFANSQRSDTDADELALAADDQKNFDESAFNAWLVADLLGSKERATVAAERFSPGLRTAFDAWLQADPMTNAAAPATPFELPAYERPLLRQATELRRAADRLNAKGMEAGALGDQYVRLTVFLAGVLFLIGIGSTFSILQVRYSLIGIGIILLCFALVLLASLPQPSFDFSLSFG